MGATSPLVSKTFTGSRIIYGAFMKKTVPGSVNKFICEPEVIFLKFGLIYNFGFTLHFPSKRIAHFL